MQDDPRARSRTARSRREFIADQDAGAPGVHASCRAEAGAAPDRGDRPQAARPDELGGRQGEVRPPVRRGTGPRTGNGRCADPFVNGFSALARSSSCRSCRAATGDHGIPDDASSTTAYPWIRRLRKLTNSARSGDAGGEVSGRLAGQLVQRLADDLELVLDGRAEQWADHASPEVVGSTTPRMSAAARRASHRQARITPHRVPRAGPAPDRRTYGFSSRSMLTTSTGRRRMASSPSWSAKYVANSSPGRTGPELARATSTSPGSSAGSRTAGRAEQVEPRHAQSLTQLPDLRKRRFDRWMHSGIVPDLGRFPCNANAPCRPWAPTTQLPSGQTTVPDPGALHRREHRVPPSSAVAALSS